MTTTAEFRVLFDACQSAFQKLTDLTNARFQKPGATPVLIDPSDEEIIIAQENYEDAWRAVSKAADTLWMEDDPKQK